MNRGLEMLILVFGIIFISFLLKLPTIGFCVVSNGCWRKVVNISNIFKIKYKA